MEQFHENLGFEFMQVDAEQKKKSIAQRKREADDIRYASRWSEAQQRKELAKNLAAASSNIRRRRGYSAPVKSEAFIEIPALPDSPMFTDSPPRMNISMKPHNIYETPRRGRSRTPKSTPSSSCPQKKMPVKKKSPVRRKASRSVTRSRSRTPVVGAGNIRVPTGNSQMGRTIRDNVRGLLYPHALTKPRHMDGAVHESQTTFERTITDITVAAGKQGVILLQPNCTNPVASTVDASIATPLVEYFVPDLLEIGLSTSAMPLSTAAGVVNKQGPVEKWRVTSQGMRLQFLNTSEQNDGWFAAFRLSTKFNVEESSLRRGTTAQQSWLGPHPTFMTRIFDAQNSSHFRSSYFVDSLKNLGQHYFRLNPYAEEHPFKDIPDSFSIAGTANFDPINVAWDPGNADTRSYQPLLDSVYDNTYDLIAVVIRAGANDAHVLIDAIQNLEVVYSNESSLARFHESSLHNPAANAAVHNAHNSNSSASIAVIS